MAKIWTPEDEDFLIAHYDELSNNELAQIYQVTPKAISHKMRRLRERLRRTRLRRERELEAAQRRIKEQEEQAAMIFEEECAPLNLPKIETYEKVIFIDGEPMDLIASGFFVKTEAGWSPVMMQKEKLKAL